MAVTLATSSIQVRPQPLGIYPLPVSFLLLPEASSRDTGEALGALLAGDASVAVDARWSFYTLAIAGQYDEAYEAIAGDGVLDEWNRFVLRPDPKRYAVLLREMAQDLLPFVHAAGYAFGLREEAPEPGDLEAELRAQVLLTAASWYLEREENEEALKLLEEAQAHARDVSPLLRAQILHQIATVEREASPAMAIAHYKEAIRLAKDTPLISLRAELWLNLGTVLQQASGGRREPLLEASRAYQESIQCGLSLDCFPELYGFAQTNLALTFLTIPARDASDQLRMGIAVQGLREALKVFRRETHPEMWSSVQLNLANALQYIPSSHPEENLQQAVELYEELLEVRSRAKDPLSYARLLANQANALAHLGIFGPALEKLNEAHKLFHWHGEPEMAASVLETTAEINQRIEEAR